MKFGMFLRQFDPFRLPKLLAGHAQHGSAWPFFVGGQHSRSAISSMLDEHGIDSWAWGATVTNDWQFWVEEGQATQAETLMIDEGVTVLGRRRTG